MAHIKPFRALRPAPDKVHLVASRSVDGYTSAQLKSKLSENPYTFLHIIQPDLRKPPRTKPHSAERLQKVKNTFLEFVASGILNREKEESFYFYRQDKDQHSFIGIFACASIEDYFNQVIKKHEETRSAREKKLMQYLEVCDFNAEPVCLCFPDDPAVSGYIKDGVSGEPIYDFTTTDRIRHRLWKCSDPTKITALTKAFDKIPSLYIADGHHRISSSALLGQSLKEKNPAHNGAEPYNFFLAALFPESELEIFEFNRLVKLPEDFSMEAFLKETEKNFIIEKKQETLWKPNKKGVFSIYFQDQWYALSLRKETERLDADLLSELILAPYFGIVDLKTDKRISFVSGLNGPASMKKIVDSGKAGIGFGLYPANVSDIMRIANAGEIMPPKSTWVEPKLRSGLVVYSLSHT